MCEKLSEKGISPFIATILLIALTVTVASLVGTWLIGFSKTSTESVESKVNLEILCNKGGISFSEVCYLNNYLSGYLTNIGTITLGNITLQVLYTNASQQTFYLNYGSGAVLANITCCGNLTMYSNEKFQFNASINSNYDRVRVYTNCTGKVTDEVLASDILTTC